MKTKLILMCLMGGLTTAPLLIAEPPRVTIVTPGFWQTVPDDYDGHYYSHNNRYYYGGKHEEGDFEWEGKHYPHRYEHEGKWIYGGKWERHVRKEVERK